MFNLDKPIVVRLKNNIPGDNINDSGKISGEEIIIEKQGKLSYIFDKDLSQMTIAEVNFISRRTDLMWDGDDDMKIYYGHVGFLGYYIAEDEIDTPKYRASEEN